MLKAKLSGPTPPEVTEAINTIVKYLQAGGWVEAIISDTGGASFMLTSIYDVLFAQLTNEPADNYREQLHGKPFPWQCQRCGTYLQSDDEHCPCETELR